MNNITNILLKSGLSFALQLKVKRAIIPGLSAYCIVIVFSLKNTRTVCIATVYFVQIFIVVCYILPFNLKG